jgi:poly-gamma-glutamate synthesis protein (capsule biosynthesis protein)
MLNGGSWRIGCPVPLSDLRYVTLTYYDFDDVERQGEMILHYIVAKDVVDIFAKLHKMRYPIRRMRLVSDYRANDYRSIEADNTSAFNCRLATGSKKWSNHSYGKAIDLNPIENPYISRRGHISHKKSLKFRVRDRGRSTLPSDRAVIKKDSIVVKLFEEKGWRWGGNWRGIKDYQHFDKPNLK